MSDETKSGRVVVDEFFAGIRDVEGVDSRVVEKLISLHSAKRLTDTNIRNAMEQLLQEELGNIGERDGED